MPVSRRRAESKTSPLHRAEAAVTPSPADLPDELIAARAYEIWRRRGCPMGQDGTQDWYAARAELEQERLGWAAPRQDDRDRQPG